MPLLEVKGLYEIEVCTGGQPSIKRAVHAASFSLKQLSVVSRYVSHDTRSSRLHLPQPMYLPHMEVAERAGFSYLGFLLALTVSSTSTSYQHTPISIHSLSTWHLSLSWLTSTVMDASVFEAEAGEHLTVTEMYEQVPQGVRNAVSGLHQT